MEGQNASGINIAALPIPDQTLTIPSQALPSVSDKLLEDDRNYNFLWFFTWFATAIVAPAATFIAASIWRKDSNLVGLYAALLSLSMVTFAVGTWRFYVVSNRIDNSVSKWPSRQWLITSFGILLPLLVPSIIVFQWSMGWLLYLFFVLLIIPALIYLDNSYERIPRRVDRNRIFDIQNTAWLVLIVSSASVVITWMEAIQGPIAIEGFTGIFQPQYFSPAIRDFSRYLLIAATVLFIAKMFNKFEELQRKVDTASSRILQLDPLTQLAERSSKLLESTLQIHTATGNIFAIHAIVNFLLQKGDQEKERAQSALAQCYGDFISALNGNVEKMNLLVNKVSDRADNAERLILLGVLESYLTIDSFSYEGIIPEFRTWRPHYAATVKKITSLLLSERPNGFEFYATLPVANGPVGFFNIGNAGANPKWSIEFLNGFLWELSTKYPTIKYRRYLLCDAQDYQSPCKDLNDLYIPHIRLFKLDPPYPHILCKRLVNSRLKAIAICTFDHWNSLKEQEKHAYCQGLDPGEFQDIAKNYAIFCPDSGGSVSFSVLSARGREFETHTVSEWPGIFKNKLKEMQGAASKLGLEYIRIQDIINEYPHQESDAGNKRYELTLDIFRSLFPDKRFYDLFAIRDCINNDWVACLAVEPERPGIHTSTERLFSNAICCDRSQEWESMKERLTELFLAGPSSGRVKGLFD